jgi:hypothetical protein
MSGKVSAAAREGRAAKTDRLPGRQKLADLDPQNIQAQWVSSPTRRHFALEDAGEQA